MLDWEWSDFKKDKYDEGEYEGKWINLEIIMWKPMGIMDKNEGKILISNGWILFEWQAVFDERLLWL